MFKRHRCWTNGVSQGQEKGDKGIRPMVEWSLNSNQNIGFVLWTGVICHHGWLADPKRLAQLAGELGEVCSGTQQPAEDSLG